MRVSLILLVCLLTFQSLAQTKEMEELLQKAKTTKGQEKIKVLDELSKKYSAIDPRQGLAYGNEALQLAEALKLSSLKSTVYLNIGLNYLRLSKSDTARFLFYRGLRNATLFRDSTAIAQYYHWMGFLYEFEGKSDSAILVFRKQLEIYRLLKNDERTGTTLENIGTIYLNRGEFKSATTYLLEAKSIFEKTGGKNRLVSVYMKLGQIFSETNDFQDAEKWLQKAIDESVGLEDRLSAGYGLNSLGIVYKKQGRYDEALVKFNAALENIGNLTAPRLLLSIYANMGNVYLSQKRPLDAIAYHTKSMEVAQKLKSPGPIAVQQFSLGLDHFNLKNYTVARSYYEKALPVFKSLKSKSDLLKTYESLIEVNNALEDYRQSVLYYDQAGQLKDSLYKDELNSALDSLKVKFRTEETDRENIRLTQESEYKDRTIHQQRTIIIFSLLFFLLLTIFVVFIVRSRRKIKKLNDQYLELLKFKDTMTSFLVHDLKNGLNTIINLEPGNGSPNQREAIRNSGKRMLNLVLNLLDIGKFESNKMDLNIGEVSVNTVIVNTCKHLKYSAEIRSVKFSVDYSEDHRILADPEILERVMINLLDNAIRFSEMGATIEIKDEIAAPGRLRITVKDFGQGIPADLLPRIFSKYTTGSKAHSGGSPSFGLGLNFCKWAMEAQQGEISIASGEGKGTVVTLILPLAMNRNGAVQPAAPPAPEETENAGVSLSAAERKMVKPFCERLRLQNVHQISDIKDILNEIDGDRSPAIDAWKRSVHLALNNCNQVRFDELINITE